MLQRLRLPTLTDATWHRSLRLETLIRLRWFAVVGQTTAIVAVYWALNSDLPLDLCLLTVAASAWVNIALRLRYPPHHRLSPFEAGASLSWDIVQLAILLYLTGGLENPFSFLFLAPVLISATSQPPRVTLIVGVLAVVSATVVAYTPGSGTTTCACRRFTWWASMRPCSSASPSSASMPGRWPRSSASSRTR
jgi:two-component system, sensor histidine kinase RegB